MKNRTFFLITIFILLSFKDAKKIDYTIISGKVENPVSNNLFVLNRHQDILKSINLKDDNTFEDTLYLDKGFYSLSDGNENTQIYIEPGADFYLIVNTKEFDESLIYKGKGANENNYLAKKYLKEESFGKLNYYGYYAKLNEKDFLKLTDSLYQVQLDFLNSYKNLSKEFISIETKSLEYGKLDKYSSYEMMRRFITNDNNFKVSSNYPNPFKKINLSNEKLLLSPNYLPYIKSYLNKTTTEILNRNLKNADFTLEYVKTVIKKVKNTTIKEELLYSVGKWKLNYTKKLDSVYNTILPHLKNKEYINIIKKKYHKLKKIEKGAISPNFELKDIKGNTVILSQLKGKLVYIDIWATWCLPCLKEIPYLKELEEYFNERDIIFISIAKDDNKERWKKMVVDKDLSGIQIFAENSDISFFIDYSVQGIPRFILIDKEGKIIDANAKRPSNPELKKEIESYLK